MDVEAKRTDNNDTVNEKPVFFQGNSIKRRGQSNDLDDRRRCSEKEGSINMNAMNQMLVSYTGVKKIDAASCSFELFG
jgi:hypothetical protein